MLAMLFFSFGRVLEREGFRCRRRRRRACRHRVGGGRRELTGPSPKSFSGFWKDIVVGETWVGFLGIWELEVSIECDCV